MPVEYWTYGDFRYHWYSVFKQPYGFKPTVCVFGCREVLLRRVGGIGG